jgi:L-alanine-DL-glutamate epimerase-like enolase superfamily enzyme
MKIDQVECWVLRAPITNPVRSSFGAMNNRPAVFVRITAADGAWGWGEVFCNFPQVGAEHRGRLIDSLLGPLAVGFNGHRPESLRTHLEAQTHRMALQCGEPGPFSQTIAALDQAMWDMAARRAGLPLWRLLVEGHPTKANVRVYASGLGPDQVVDMALEKRQQGYRAFKLKVGFPGDTDLRNLQALREALGPHAVLMLDANQAWRPDEAVDRIGEMAKFHPYWMEEPIAADEPLSSWKGLSEQCNVPLAAGENIRGIGDFRAALEGGHLKFVQPDLAKWGGVSGCMEVGRMAERSGVTFCPHWLGGGIGLAATLQMRAALGDGGFVEVDANPNPLRDEVVPPLDIQDGTVTLSDTPGIGVEPDLALMQKYRVAA